MEPRIIETARGAVECAVTGDGPVVLALHGAMGGYDQSMLLARAAMGARGFRIIAVSRPGYLGSPLVLGRTPEEQADLCASLLDALAVPEAAVIAISGGGQCALQFALRHAERCWGLAMVSACSAPIPMRPPLGFYLMRLMVRFPPALASMRRGAATRPERTARRSIPDPELRARTLDDPEAGPMLLALQLSVMERMADRMPGTDNDIKQSRRPFAYLVERISAPALVVHGTADKAVPFAQAISLAARIPGAELLSIEDGGHVSIFTHLREIRPKVRSFFEAHAPRR